LKQSQESVA